MSPIACAIKSWNLTINGAETLAAETQPVFGKGLTTSMPCLVRPPVSRESFL